MLERRCLDYGDAAGIVSRIVERARQDGLPAVSVAVVDDRGDLLASARMDGASSHTMNLAMNKAYTAARMRRSTRDFRERMPKLETRTAWYGDPRFTGLDGGIMVVVNRTVVGAIGVSGRKGHEDRELAEVGAEGVAASV